MRRRQGWFERRPLAEAGLGLACLLAVKAALIAVDPSLRFYFGDSATYYFAAIDGWIPVDRSFTYPWLLRYAVLPTGSALALLWMQALFGVASGLLLMWWLRRAGLPLPWSLAAGLLCVLEPSQLFYERMMMAESAGQLALLAMLTCVAGYVAGRRWAALWALGMALAGVAAVSMRMSLLPVVLGLSALAPFLRFHCSETRASVEGHGWMALRLAGHACMVLLATALVHQGYQGLYGRLSGTEPAYMRAEGQMRLGLVAPLVKPAHIERVGLPADLLDRLEHPLDDHRAREAQLWMPGGLWPQLLKAVEAGEAKGLPSPDHWSANLHAQRLASKVSARALQQDPMGLVRMGLATFRDYFDAEIVKVRITDDLGRFPVHEPMATSLRERLNHHPADFVEEPGPIARIFARSTGWLTAVLFMLAPVSLWLAITGLRGRGKRAGTKGGAIGGANRQVQEAHALRLVLGVAGLGLVASQFLFSHIVSFRYLQPLPPVFIAGVFLIAWDLRCRLPRLPGGRAALPGTG